MEVIPNISALLVIFSLLLCNTAAFDAVSYANDIKADTWPGKQSKVNAKISSSEIIALGFELSKDSEGQSYINRLFPTRIRDLVLNDPSYRFTIQLYSDSAASN